MDGVDTEEVGEVEATSGEEEVAATMVVDYEGGDIVDNARMVNRDGVVRGVVRGGGFALGRGG